VRHASCAERSTRSACRCVIGVSRRRFRCHEAPEVLEPAFLTSETADTAFQLCPNGRDRSPRRRREHRAGLARNRFSREGAKTRRENLNLQTLRFFASSRLRVRNLCVARRNRWLVVQRKPLCPLRLCGSWFLRNGSLTAAARARSCRCDSRWSSSSPTLASRLIRL